MYRRSYVGFHGTTREYADIILRTNNFIASTDEEEWLGNGVYFFEDDVFQAYDYCVKAKKYAEYAILKSHIEAEIVLDLINKKTFKEFNDFAKRLQNRYLKRKDGKPRRLINAVVLNFLYELKPYDMVRAAFPVPPGYTAPRTNVTQMQIQLCVNNKSCIKTIEEVQCSGY